MEMTDIFDELMNANLKGIDFKQKISEKAPKRNEEEKRMKPSEKLLHDIEKNGFNLSQMEVILKTKGNQLVVSCAGSGKTTTLVFKILYDLKSGYSTRVVEVKGNPIRVPEKIWVCTFLNSGAEELKISLRKWVHKLGIADISDTVQFSTIHAEFKRALKQFGLDSPIVSDSLNMGYLKEVVKGYQLKNAKGNSLNSEDYKMLSSALSYTRNRLDADRYSAEVYDDLNIGPSLVDAIIRDWRAKRVQNGVVDFEDLQEIIYDECYNKNNTDLISFIGNRYSFIYIDEFQDTSQVQYAVLKLYIQNARQVFTIGDDDQTIYSWRGSDNRIITSEFPKDFNPVVSKLSVNYRCPSNILKAIVPSITLNENRYEKELKSFSEGGEVRVLEGYNYTDMVEKLADCVYNDLTKGRSVAVLCRVNTDGLLPALMFDKIGRFSYSISGSGMTLDSYVGTTVMSIIKLFTEKSTSAVSRALNMLAWDSYGIGQLLKVFKTNRLSIWDVDPNDLSYSCPSIAERIMRWRSVRESSGDLEALKFILKDYRVHIFYKDSQFNDVMRSTLMSVEAMLNYSNYSDVESFLYELEDINDRLKGRMKVFNSSVKIATVHEFKGKEADSVYIWNDSEGVFPIKNVTYGTDMYEEERRVHYIACTRARQVSTLVYLRGKGGAFVGEMDLDGAEWLSGTKVLQGIISKKSEEDKNLNTFAEKVLGTDVQESSDKPKGGISIHSPVDGYRENEFWGYENETEFTL